MTVEGGAQVQPLRTDEELIEGVLAGRLGDYDRLMKRYERLIYKIAYGFGGSPENALDLSQTIFLQVYRKLSSFRGKSSFKTWLTRIAYNEGVSWVRSNRRHSEGRESLAEDEPRVGEIAVLYSTEAPQEAEQRERDSRRLLLRGMRGLSERYQKALVLRYFHELSLREVAAVLDCSEGVAKNTLFRGMRNLRKAMTEA